MASFKSSDKTKKILTTNTRKIMATVFWNRKGVLLIDFLPRVITINAERCCWNLGAPLETAGGGYFQAAFCFMTILGSRCHKDNDATGQISMEITGPSTYRTDLAWFRLSSFPKTEVFLGGKWLESDDVLKESVNDWLNGQAAEFFNDNIQKLVPRLKIIIVAM